MSIESDLWNESAEALYEGNKLAVQAALLDQYKLYVEMADRVSQRRGLTNTFFLTLNTAIFTLIGVFWKDRPSGDEWWLVFPVIAVVVQCVAWFYLVRSYRLLNSAKFEVIGVMEKRLPSSPWWKAEWTALAKGKDKNKYWPLSHIEQWVPVTFAFTYVAGFVAALAA